MAVNFPHTHPLTKYINGEECVCIGCKTPIRLQARYGCKTCNLYLHECCATSPESIFTDKHRHELTLARLDKHWCDFCGDRVEGFFYRCKDCDFDIHPLCSQAAIDIQHVLHRDHPLTIYKFTVTPTSPPHCLICSDKITSLHYRCETSTCGVYIHFHCIQENTWTLLGQPWPVPDQAMLLALTMALTAQARALAAQAQAGTAQAMLLAQAMQLVHTMAPARGQVRRRDKVKKFAKAIGMSLLSSGVYDIVKELKPIIDNIVDCL